MNSLVADIVAMVVCLEVENYVAASGLCEVEEVDEQRVSCRVTEGGGGGSRGRVEETRCSELRRLSGRDARRVRIRLRGRTQARPLANKSRRRDWRSDRPAFRMLLLAVVPCSGRGPLDVVCPRGKFSALGTWIVRYTINSHVALERCNCSCGLQRC